MTWERVPLKRVAAIRVSNVDKKLVDGDPPVRLCNYTDVYNRGTIRNDQEFMAATATPEQLATFRLRPGDVIITKDSETAHDIGAPAWVESAAPDLVCGYHLAMLRPDALQIAGRFLYWTMAADPTREQLAVAATGVTRFGLRAESISSLMVDLPSIARQRAIADFLDAETARIDALLAQNDGMRRLIDERATRRMNDLFSVNHVVDRHGIPIAFEGLRSVRLGYLADVQTGVTLDAGRDTGDQALSAPYLRVAKVQDGRLDLDELKDVTVPADLGRRCLLQAGDVLMTEGGDPDKLGRGTVWPGTVAPCLHQNHIFAVRPDTSRLLPEYLALVTRTSYARRYFEVTASKTTGIASTSSDKIRSFRIPLPDLAEQGEIVGANAAALQHELNLRCVLVSQSDLLKERRHALVTAAVSGDLDIPGAA